MGLAESIWALEKGKMGGPDIVPGLYIVSESSSCGGKAPTSLAGGSEDEQQLGVFHCDTN